MAKILFLTSRFPYPLEKGDKLRAYYQIRELSAFAEIHLLALESRRISTEQYRALSPFCESIRVMHIPLALRILSLFRGLFSGLPLQVAFFYSRRAKRKTEQIVAQVQPDYIHCHLIRTAEYVKEIRGIPATLDFMDAFGKGMLKREQRERNPLKKLLFAFEKRRLYAYESSMFERFNRFSAISQQDADALLNPENKPITVIPNGVDFDIFHPRDTDRSFDLVFMGNLGYPPNIDAIHFLVEEIMPKVWKSRPETTLLLAGVGAPASLRSLVNERVKLLGDFPDISDSLAMARVMIAPMRLSIGLQNKVLQAMAMQIPCIVSRGPNQAIQAPAGYALLEADTADEFALAVLTLLSDTEMAARIGQAGYRFVKEHYSWEKQNLLLKTMILQ